MTENNNDSLGNLLGVKFDENGKVESIKDTGKTPMFIRKNHKQRRQLNKANRKFTKILKRI